MPRSCRLGHIVACDRLDLTRDHGLVTNFTHLDHPAAFPGMHVVHALGIRVPKLHGSDPQIVKQNLAAELHGQDMQNRKNSDGARDDKCNQDLGREVRHIRHDRPAQQTA